MSPRQCECREWILKCCAILCFWAELDEGRPDFPRTLHSGESLYYFFHGFQINTCVSWYWFEHRFSSGLVVAHMLHAVPMCHRPWLTERLLVCCALQVCAAFLENCKKVSPFLWLAWLFLFFCKATIQPDWLIISHGVYLGE